MALEYCGSLPFRYRVEEVSVQDDALTIVSEDALSIDLPIQ
jgi:hypothetical protein